MSTSILDQVASTQSTRRGELLAEYRRLLTKGDTQPVDADRLLETCGWLGFPLSRLPSDMTAVREAARFERDAADFDDAETVLETAFAASERHREKMEKTLQTLRQKQAELDSEVSSSRGRLSRAANARRELADLRAEHADLFADIADKAAEAEREKLESLASELPAVRAELDQAQAALAEAEAAFDLTIAECERTPPNHADKQKTIQAKTDALQARDALVGRIADLHEAIHECESARRELAKEE